jgi:hypothetical protein
MFEGWDSFYLLIGGGSGGLIGLLFVVATLNSGLDRETSLRGASLYMTPLVYHFGVVLVASATALSPRTPLAFAGTILGVATLGGLAHALRFVLSARRPGLPAPPHWSDLWLYGVASGVIYLGLGLAALGVWRNTGWAADATALALVALLLLTIRNAWDLVTWLAPGLPPGKDR